VKCDPENLVGMLGVLDLFGDVIGDSLSFAVRVCRDVDSFGLLRLLFQFFYDFFLAWDYDISWRKILIDVDPSSFAGRSLIWLRGLHVKIASEYFIYRLRLAGDSTMTRDFKNLPPNSG